MLETQFQVLTRNFTGLIRRRRGRRFVQDKNGKHLQGFSEVGGVKRIQLVG